MATQSISFLRAVLGQSEAWRALLQTLRTRIILSLADDSSAETASSLCGEVIRMKASYTVSAQTARASASVLPHEFCPQNTRILTANGAKQASEQP